MGAVSILRFSFRIYTYIFVLEYRVMSSVMFGVSLYCQISLPYLFHLFISFRSTPSTHPLHFSFAK